MVSESSQSEQRRVPPGGWWIGIGLGVPALPVVFMLDPALAAILRSDMLPWLVGILRYATWLGYGLVDIAIPVVIGVAARGRGDRNGGRRGLLGGSAVAAAGLLDQVLKNLLCRARPNAVDAGLFFREFPCVPARYAVASFPSGHATTVFALATVLSLWYPRWTAAWLALAAVVGWSRIVLGSHFPSDVVAGAVLGVAVALVFFRWVPGTGKCEMEDRAACAAGAAGRQPTTDQ
jgi:membrane-associated phospholipid phosphatase